MYKRLELLPEEAIYLVERGALFCWKQSDLLTKNTLGLEGSPMSVHQAYSEMIGMENLTLDKYQVHSSPSLSVFLWSLIWKNAGIRVPEKTGIRCHSSRPSYDVVSQSSSADSESNAGTNSISATLCCVFILVVEVHPVVDGRFRLVEAATF